MKNKLISIWEDTIKIKKQSKKKDIKNDNQNQNLNFDILIVGGGITGCQTAYFLKNSNYKIGIIDKGKIGMGITKNTTAKISFLQQTIYQDLEKKLDQKKSKLYFDSQIEASKLLTDIIDKEKISCHLEKVDSYLFAVEEKNIDKIKKEQKILQNWQVACKEVKELPIKFPIKYGIMVKDTYVFHPLEYLQSIKKILQKKITFLEEEMVLKIERKKNRYLVKTTQREISCTYLVLSCHYPYFVFPNMFPIKNHIKREYVNAGKWNQKMNFTAINVDKALHSIRFFEDTIIYGSNEHLLMNQIDYQKHYKKSRQDFNHYFKIDPTYTWMNQDIVTNDQLPLIGKLSAKYQNLFLATGYQAWGMTNATIASKIISDLIQKKKNQYLNLFDPTRINPAMISGALYNSILYGKIYLETYLQKNPSFYKKNVAVVPVKGNYYGVYIDENNQKHIVKHLCPHMKCHLIFNQEEKTWDCPCHGSRFTIDGDIIEGPANYSIKI
ncbi:MAG: FAD-dependent oxidoreductase [bacterium]|nr:FAD-dependent oxidoreductase [bacterium]